MTGIEQLDKLFSNGDTAVRALWRAAKLTTNDIIDDQLQDRMCSVYSILAHGCAEYIKHPELIEMNEKIAVMLFSAARVIAMSEHDVGMSVRLPANIFGTLSDNGAGFTYDKFECEDAGNGCMKLSVVIKPMSGMHD